MKEQDLSQGLNTYTVFYAEILEPLMSKSLPHPSGSVTGASSNMTIWNRGQKFLQVNKVNFSFLCKITLFLQSKYWAANYPVKISIFVNDSV